MRNARRRFGALTVAAVILAGVTGTVVAQEAVRTVLYSLEVGETILHRESMIALTAEAADVVLVTTRGNSDQGPFFVFRDGTRKGPFTSLKDAMATAYAGRENPQQRKRDCAAYAPGPAPEGSQPATSEDRSGSTLRFKGATIGPHRVLLSFKVTPDGARLYVTASDDDKAWFESSDGRKVSFGGIPMGFQFGPDGKNAAVQVEGRYSMNEMKGLPKLPPEKFAEAAKELGKKYVYTIDGQMYGPFDSIDDLWFPNTSNDLYFRAQGQVFRNGVPLPKARSFNSCEFYPSPDGRSYAVVDYANITFSDGKAYPSPLAVVAYQDKGKLVFRWITLEKNKDVVVYQRTM